MTNEAFIAVIEAERARAVQMVDACDAVLRVYRPAPPAKVTVAPPVAKAAKREKPARPQLVAAPRAEAGESKVATYRDAVVKVLGRYEHGADGAVIRREVAKVCGVKPENDEHFSQDIGNALQNLKHAKVVDRSGQVWALMQKAASA